MSSSTGHGEIDYLIGAVYEDGAAGQHNGQHSEDLIRIIEAELAKQISGFYEDEIPQFTQGAPTHELEDLVTAAEVTAYVSKITQLTSRIDSLFAAIEHGDGAHRAWLKDKIDQHFQITENPK